LLSNPAYPGELEAMCKDITENRGLLIYFNGLGRSYLPSQEDVRSACHLSVLHYFADGTVYSNK